MSDTFDRAMDRVRDEMARSKGRMISDIGEMVTACFRKPNEGEPVKTLNTTQMLKLMQQQYPTLKISHSVKIMLGQAMKELGFEHTEHSHVAFYKAIPLKAA